MLPILEENYVNSVRRGLLVHGGYVMAVCGYVAARVPAIGVPDDLTYLLSYEVASTYLKGRGEVSIPLNDYNRSEFSASEHPMTGSASEFWDTDSKKAPVPTFNPFYLYMASRAIGGNDCLLCFDLSKVPTPVWDRNSPEKRAIVMPVEFSD